MDSEILRLHAHDGTEFSVDKSAWETEHSVEVGKNLVFKAVPSDLNWQATHKQHTTYIKFSVCGKFELRIHRLLLDCKQGDIVDHIDRNGCNNTSANLRLVSSWENSLNRSPNRNKRFKGMNWNKRQKKFHAHIRVHGKKIHLGSFATDVEAALAYDEAARHHFGEFAALNFPETNCEESTRP